MTKPASLHNRRVLVIDDNVAIHQDFLKVLGGKTEDGAAADFDAWFKAQTESAIKAHETAPAAAPVSTAEKVAPTPVKQPDPVPASPAAPTSTEAPK